MFWDIHLSRFHPSAFPFFSLIKAPFWFVALRQLHSRAQNRKAARFSGSCFLNSKPTEEGKISQKKQRGLEEWHVQEGISLGWRRAESWWENTQVLLCSGSLGHKEMVLWAPKGSGQDPRHRSSCLRQSCLCPMWCENREPPDTECLDSKDASSEHRDLKLEKPFFFFFCRQHVNSPPTPGFGACHEGEGARWQRRNVTPTKQDWALRVLNQVDLQKTKWYFLYIGVYWDEIYT